MNPSSRALISALRECGELGTGRVLHAQAIHQHCFNIYTANSLVAMYARCGSLADAEIVFSKMPHHSVVSWNSLMLGYSESSNHHAELALNLCQRIEASSRSPLTYVAALKSCNTLAAEEEPRRVSVKKKKKNEMLVRVKSLETAMAIHSQAASAGFVSDAFVATTLISLYSNCGSVEDARMIFDTMKLRNVIAWNALVLGYAENDEPELALELFSCMCSSEEKPSAASFVAAIKACSNLRNKAIAMDRSLEILAEASALGLDSEINVACSMITFYSKCGRMEESRKIFDGLNLPSVIAWNALISGYAENREEEKALGMFFRMQQQAKSCKACSPSALTCVAALKACCNLAETKKSSAGEFLELGVSIHRGALEWGFVSDVRVSSALVNMYAKCGSMMDSRVVFDGMKSRNLVSWNSLIMGYVENDEPGVALSLFSEMQTRGYFPDARSFVAALKACSLLAAGEEPRLVDGKSVKVDSLETGRALHRQAADAGVDGEIFVESSLVDMYAKCGSMGEARVIFDDMNHRDVVSWTALLLGLAENNSPEEALGAFGAMLEEGSCVPDARTYAAVLKACSLSAKFEAGRRIHASICKAGLESEWLLVHGLMELYGKCGSMVEAQLVFDSLIETRRDVVIYTTLLGGYSLQANSDRVFEVFREMGEQGVEPDGVTLLCVLSACSHGGLLEKGRRLFERMRKGEFGVEPGIEHYHCVVDMLGRGNRVKEAVEIVSAMPFRPNEVTWLTLLGACEKSSDVACGKVAFERLLELRGRDELPSSSAAYSLMRNLSSSHS